MGDRPLCKCIAYKEMNTINTTLCEIHGTSAPSPARDDAETAIAGLLAEHTHWQYAKYSEDRTTVCVCGALEIGNLLDAEAPLPPDAHRAHVASVIAAHMAAPDELTALRERIRALADEWAAFPNHDTLHLCARDLRRLLGDA